MLDRSKDGFEITWFITDTEAVLPVRLSLNWALGEMNPYFARI